MSDFSLQTNVSKETIEKMISMVDKKLVEKIFLGAATLRNKKVVDAKLYDGIVDKYLEMWATQKGKFFLLMGEKLKSTTTFNEPLSHEEFSEMISELNKNYPIYSPLVKMFNQNDVVNNRCPKNDILSESCKGYKEGMKLSKFLSRYLADAKFDVELSRIIQYKTVQSEVGLSIDPVDYLIMGINKHNWWSCYGIGELYGAAPFSCMTDTNTLISYQKTDKLYEYAVGTSTFEAHSFKQRSAVMIEDNLQYTVLDPMPGRATDAFEVAVRGLITSSFDTFFGEKVQMVKSGCARGKYNMVARRHHMQDDLSNYIWVQEGHKSHYFPMGRKDLPCLVTGKMSHESCYNYPLAV